MEYTSTQIESILNKIDFSIFDRENFSKSYVEDFFLCSTTKKILEKVGISINYGISKMVFIPKQYNFVIKIPFKGDFEEFEFKPFIKAFCPLTSSTNNDYCKLESEYYRIAQQEQVEEFFSETKYYTTIHNIPIYISEKVQPWNKSLEPSRKEKVKVLKKLMRDNFPILYNEIPFFLVSEKYYEASAIKRCLQFLKDHHIGDLRSDNLGIRISNNQPVIVDYSDFRD